MIALLLALLSLVQAHELQTIHSSALHYPLCSAKGITTSKFILDGKIAFVGHFGSEGEILFTISTAGSLYRSGDGGMSWTHIDQTALGVPDARVRSIAPSANSKTGSSEVKLYIAGSGYLWTTRDGKTFTKQPKMPTYVYPHPTMDEVALGGFEDNPCEIWITQDLGSTWTKAADGRRPQWVNSAKRISFLHLALCAPESPVTTSTFDGSSWTDSQARGLYKSLYSVAWTGYVTVTDNHEQVFLATNTKDELQISRNAGQTWIHAFLPTVDGPPTQYVVYGVDDGAIFLNARAASSQQPERVGELFVSGNNTELFTLSLPGNARRHGAYNGIGGFGDFEKVHSVDGVFLANAYEGNSDKNLQTWITYDMGAEWKRLVAPLVHADASPTNCSPEAGCYLNLFGLADQHDIVKDYGGYGRFYSVPSAVGIIFGTGNLGPHLDLSGKVNTYFSRDAGVTWTEVRDGRWAYEIADHGSLLALVNREEKTNHMLYTWNEGILWQPCNFTAEADSVKLENLITETQFTSQKFLLYGTAMNDRAQSVGVLFGVDFSGMHERQCQNADDPTASSSDYEFYEIEGGRECILGMKTKYVRRKQDAECFNPNTHPVNKRQYEPCLCKREDFECGPCYKEDGNDCKRIPNCKDPTVEEQCTDSCYYFSKQEHMKYFRIAGDQCFGGEEWERLEEAELCPEADNESCAFLHRPSPTDSNDSSGGGGTAFVVILALLVVGILIFVGVVCVTKKPAGVYAVFAKCRGQDRGYRKLDLGGGASDTTSFFDDDELADN